MIYDITVVTSRPRGWHDLPRHEILDGVTVFRTRSTSFDRAKIGLRAVNYVTYLADTLIRAISLKRHDIVLCMTDPPIVGDVAFLVARRHRAPLLVISEDVFPEVATELGRLENPLLVGTLSRLIAFYLARADHIVAIGERMKERLAYKGAPPQRMTVIPNWVDTNAVVPVPRDNAWSQAQGLIEKFTIMHSGNVGHAQNLDNLVRATTFVRDLEDLAVPIVGFGARHTEIKALADRLAAESVVFLPYQPREVLSQSLGAAHMHYVGLAKGLSGFVVPSRVYGILAAGRPVLAAADADSETARLINEAECGVTLPPDRPDLLAAAIRDAHDGRLDLERMGARGREFVVREADRSVALARYRLLIGGLITAC